MDGQAVDPQSPVALAAVEKIKRELTTDALKGKCSISSLCIKVRWAQDDLRDLGHIKKFVALYPDVFDISMPNYVALKDFTPEPKAAAPKLGSSKAPAMLPMGMGKAQSTTAGIPAPRIRGWEEAGSQEAPPASGQDWSPDAGGKGYGTGKAVGKGSKASKGETPPSGAPTGKAKWAPAAKASPTADDVSGSTSFVPKSQAKGGGGSSSMPVPPKNPPPVMGGPKRPPPAAGVSRPKWAPATPSSNEQVVAVEDVEQNEDVETEGSWGEPAWKMRKGDSQGKGGKLPSKTSDWQSEGSYGMGASMGGCDGEGHFGRAASKGGCDGDGHYGKAASKGGCDGEGHFGKAASKGGCDGEGHFGKAASKGGCDGEGHYGKGASKGGGDGEGPHGKASSKGGFDGEGPHGKASSKGGYDGESHYGKGSSKGGCDGETPYGKAASKGGCDGEGPYGKAPSKGGCDGKGAADWQGKGDAQPEDKGFAKGDGKGTAGYGALPAAKFPPQSKQPPAPMPQAEQSQPSKGGWEEDQLADAELAAMITTSKLRGIELELVALSKRLAGSDEMRKNAVKLTNIVRSTCLRVHRDGLLGPGKMPPVVEMIGSYMQGTEIDGAEVDVVLRMPIGTRPEEKDAFSKALFTELGVTHPSLPTLTVSAPLQHFAHTQAICTVELSSEQPTVLAHVLVMDQPPSNPAERHKNIDSIIKTFCDSSDVAREMARLVKLWACNHGLASSADGFMGGVCWTVLTLCFLQKEQLLPQFAATVNGEQPPRQNSRPQVFVLLRSFMTFLTGLMSTGAARGFSLLAAQEFTAPTGAALFLEDPMETLAQRSQRNMAEGLGEAQMARVAEEAKKAADRLSSRPQRWFHWAEIFDPREVPKDKIAKLAPLREIAGLVPSAGGKAPGAVSAKSAMFADPKASMASQAKSNMGGKGYAPGGGPAPGAAAGGAAPPKSGVPAAFGGKGPAALPARPPGKGGAGPGMMYGKR